MPAPPRTATQLRDAIVHGELTAEAACDTALERIASVDETLHAFLHVDGTRARERAR